MGDLRIKTVINDEIKFSNAFGNIAVVSRDDAAKSRAIIVLNRGQAGQVRDWLNKALADNGSTRDNQGDKGDTMTTYKLLQLTQSGDKFAVEIRPNGRIFATDALTDDESGRDFTDMNYDDEVNVEAFDLGILSTDLESSEPMGDRYRVIRSS